MSCTLTIAIIGNRRSQPAYDFEATAIVGAASLKLNPDRLPRTVAAIARRTEFDNTTSIRPVDGTRIIKVTVEADNGLAAARGANTDAERLADELTRAGRGIFAVISEAPSPHHTRQPPLSKDLTVGTFAGICASVAAVGLARWWGEQLNNAVEVEVKAI